MLRKRSAGESPVEACRYRFFYIPLRPWRQPLLLACVAGASISLLLPADARPRNLGYYAWPDSRYYAADPRAYAEPRHRPGRQKSRHRDVRVPPADDGGSDPEDSVKKQDAAKQQKPDEKPKTDQKQKTAEATTPSAPMFFVVSLGRQHVSVYSNDGLLARAPISSGMQGHPTPTGIFNILGKERLHHSNIYSGAPMPFMQRITWSGIALHEGVLPGYPASHGCIRMPHEFAQRMFGLTQGNERVIITRHDIAPVPFSHAKLPVPALLPAPEPHVMSASANILQNAVATSGTEATKVAVMADPETGDAPRRLVNPVDYAKAMKAFAAKKMEEATAEASHAHIAVQVRAKEMMVANVTLKKAQIALFNATTALDAAERQLQKALSAAQINAANTVKAAAEARVRDATAKVESAKLDNAAKEEAWSAAVKNYKDYDNIQKTSAERMKIWNRRTAPVSVFISRKTSRLYVRQNFLKVFDVPVTIRDPGKPLGTHLYMAMPPVKSAAEDASKLRWLVLTLSDAAEDTDRRRRRHQDDDDAPRKPASTASAADALDRIDIAPEVAAKISEMLWAGGSLIVSDNGISHETDDYSDFIILTQ